ncbi:hypothetical protein M0P65_07310 [Candidatus Gracilibacteria bacterium]|jgi:hypothetical protein|nr:hypothetical protein [Candidatus Gracilibacteria bacterium]
MEDLYFWSANLILQNNPIKQQIRCINGFVVYKMNMLANLLAEGENLFDLIMDTIKNDNDISDYNVIITCISKLTKTY